MLVTRFPTFRTIGPNPRKHPGYIPRPVLQGRVVQELAITDRHPIVSLTGPGGIGKTTLAISTINEIAGTDHPPYGVILWISARDVDLLDSGPKRVSPRAVTEREIAEAAVALLEPGEQRHAGLDPIHTSTMSAQHTGCTIQLFVFDNSETLNIPPMCILGSTLTFGYRTRS